jgi:hypothetical protein
VVEKMPFRKERDRLKDIDAELSRIKKDLLHIDKSLKSLNKIPAPAEEEEKVVEKPVKEKPGPKKGKAKSQSKPKAHKKKHKGKKR